MKAEIMALIESLGYTILETDDALIDFFMRKVDSDIKSYTNQSVMPEAMHEDYVLAVCGEFLSLKKNSGEWETSAVSSDSIKSITEGDTTVTYASADNTSSVEIMLKKMTDWEQKALCFRKMVW